MSRSSSAGMGTDQKSTTLSFVTVDAQGKRREYNSGILSDVRITPDTRQNTVIVSAPADSMELIAALVKQLDSRPTTEVQLKVFTIVNGDAVNLAMMLQVLFGQQAAGGTAQSIFAQSASNDGESLLVTARFVADLRTNSIIASGNKSDLAIAEAILLRLDDNDARRRKSVVYRLKNAPANDVANAINQFLLKQQQSPELLSTIEQIENEAVVVPELVSNSLIVSATPRFYGEIQTLVEQLDKRPSMVMIQVLLAEVMLDNFDEFGIEAGLQDSILFDRSILGNISTITSTTVTPQGTNAGNNITSTTQNIVSATNTPGYAFNNGSALGNSGSTTSLASSGLTGSQGGTNFSVGRTNTKLGYGGFSFSASSESVSLLVRALQQKQRIDVLSRPQVMTLDNQPALVQVGQRVPRVTSVNMTTFGQTNQTTLDNVGIILKVTPRISPDGLVVMQIDAEKSQISAATGIPISYVNGEAITAPILDTTIAQTTVSAVSGQTVVLGGLLTKEKDVIQRRVPYLSDIPVLGYLFRYDSHGDNRKELLIVMTPQIVNDEQSADKVKQIEAARMSWCLADAEAVHGEMDIKKRKDEWPDSQVEKVIRPDQEGVPAGSIPAPPSASPTPKTTPTPAPKQSTSQTILPTPAWPTSQGQPDAPSSPSGPEMRIQQPDNAKVQPNYAVPANYNVPATYNSTPSSGVVPAGYQPSSNNNNYQR